MPNAGAQRIPPLVPDHDLLRCIGSGSYGEVWLARNVMGTFRAVKIVYRQTFDNERPYQREFDGMQKFEPVSRTHDGLVDILQVGRNESAGYYYYVMELCDDVTSGQAIDPDHYEPRTVASDLVRTTRLSFQECLQIGLSLSDALGHLHDQGLVHRDIKPSNIIFVHGIPKIADIGLVAELGAPQSFVGTQGFIPPEGPGTSQADIYSLGKVLYEMSSGKDRQTYPELPTQLDSFGDRAEYLELNEVVLKACASDPRRRYANAREMHADLLLLQAGKSVKRLRLLEYRLAILMRLGLVGVILAFIGVFAHYQTWRAERRETRRLLEAYLAHATRSIQEGDLIGSLPWLAKVLPRCAKAGVPETPHRVRIAAVLDQCPKIVSLWLQPTVVNHADFSPDGRRVVTALKDHRATIWDTATGKLILELTNHSDEVQMAKFSPDGSRILTASLDGTARLWDATTGDQIGPALEHPAALYSARFHPRSEQLITACGDAMQGCVRLWEPDGDGWRFEELTSSGSAYRNATFSHDGFAIATACEDGNAILWTHNSAWQPARTNHHGDNMWVFQMNFSPEDNYVASGGFDRRILVWDRQRQELALPPLAHRGAVHDLCFSPDGRQLLVACLDYTVHVWDVTRGITLTMLRHTGNVTSANYSPDGRYVVTTGIDGVTRIWDLGSLGWCPPQDSRTFSGNGRVAVIATSQTLEILRPLDSQSPSIIPLAHLPLHSFKLNHDGSRLVIFSPAPPDSAGRFHAQSWNTVNAQALAPVFECDSILSRAVLDNTVALSHDGNHFLGYHGPHAGIWDARDGRPFLGPLQHAAPVVGGFFSPNGRRFATLAGNDVHLWEFPSGKRIAVLHHQSSANYAVFSSDSRLLATTCANGGFEAFSAQLWNADDGQAFGPPRPHRDGVLSARFNMDASRILTASEDTTAGSWSLSDSAPSLTLNHDDEVYDACFNHEENWILTTCRDGKLRLWQSDNGIPITPPLQVFPPNSTWNAQFVLDGYSVLVSRKPDRNYLIQLTPSTDTAETIELKARLLSGHEGSPTGSLFPLSTNQLWNTWTNLQHLSHDTRYATPEECRAWHEREVMACESQNLHFASLFHLERLAALNPEDETLRHRRDLARARFEKASSSPSP